MKSSCKACRFKEQMADADRARLRRNDEANRIPTPAPRIDPGQPSRLQF
ncbi:hypothetical protein MUP00_09595 [Candidatus Bathyarchaeota archaeon]|nr:hypothetical protein [Candidatus Bathyarchaeota archaeon]